MYFDFILYEKMDDDLIDRLVKKTSIWEVFHVGTYELQTNLQRKINNANDL